MNVHHLLPDTDSWERKVFEMQSKITFISRGGGGWVWGWGGALSMPIKYTLRTGKRGVNLFPWFITPSQSSHNCGPITSTCPFNFLNGVVESFSSMQKINIYWAKPFDACGHAGRPGSIGFTDELNPISRKHDSYDNPLPHNAAFWSTKNI